MCGVIVDLRQRLPDHLLLRCRNLSALGQTMRKKTATSMESELIKLRLSEKKLHEALCRLFELLERYSPVWYDERAHEQAKAALKHLRRTA